MENELLVDFEFEQLIKGCVLGCNKRQTELYKKYYYLIFNVCLKYLKNKMESEDLTQDIFLKLVTKLDKFKGCNYAQLTTWIKVSSRNHVIDYIRSKKINENIEDVSNTLLIDNIDLSIIDDDHNRIASDIKNAISTLPKQYKAVFELYYISNYSHEEIAEELNLHVGTSKSNLFKAKRKLALALSQYNKNYN
jgi:RNA polymerase sigma factor (sigma-70 family)